MYKLRDSININCSTCPNKHLCLPKNLPEQDINILNSVITKYQFVEKGSHIYRVNEQQDYLYAIYSGTCKDYTITEDGDEYINNFYFAGDILALESIPLKQYFFSAKAITDSYLCMIPINQFLDQAMASPALLKRFIDIGSYKMLNDTHIRRTTNARQRIADFLLNIIYRIEERNNINNNILLPMTQMEISNQVGMAYETVSRILHAFADEKIISIDSKQVNVIDINKLKTLGNNPAELGQKA
jgi:CRP/FNR family transcriptional regulator, anaerobic regulatory protein